jgi:hypothetical protein
MGTQRVRRSRCWEGIAYRSVGLHCKNSLGLPRMWGKFGQLGGESLEKRREPKKKNLHYDASYIKIDAYLQVWRKNAIYVKTILNMRNISILK